MKVTIEQDRRSEPGIPLSETRPDEAYIVVGADGTGEWIGTAIIAMMGGRFLHPATGITFDCSAVLRVRPLRDGERVVLTR